MNGCGIAMTMGGAGAVGPDCFGKSAGRHPQIVLPRGAQALVIPSASQRVTRPEAVPGAE